METPAWLIELDHTGDAAFQIRAPSLPELFERAATALFRHISDLSSVQPRTSTQIVLSAHDLASLFVAWLSELNFLHVTTRLVFSEFSVAFAADLCLEARAFGEPFDPTRHTLYTEIKAITYHGLSIRQDGEEWTATMILDL